MFTHETPRSRLSDAHLAGIRKAIASIDASIDTARKSRTATNPEEPACEAGSETGEDERYEEENQVGFIAHGPRHPSSRHRWQSDPERGYS